MVTTRTVLPATIRRADFRKYIEENQTDFIQFKTDIYAQGRYRPGEAKPGHQLHRGEHLEDQEPDYPCLLYHRLLSPLGRERGDYRECAQQLRAQRNERAGEGRTRAAGLVIRWCTRPAQTGQQMGGTIAEDKLREVEDLIVQIVIHHGEETHHRERL